MYFPAVTAAAAALLMPVIEAKSLGGMLSPFQLRRAPMDDLFRRDVNPIVWKELDRRDAMPEPATATASAAAAISSADSAAFNTTTTTNCKSALSVVTTASNPAGILACYNIPFLDTTTNVFEADLRLYQVNTPTGNFTGVKTDGISVALTYPEATVQSEATKMKRMVLNARVNEDDTTTVTDGSTTAELQDFRFIGTIDQTLTLSKIDDAQIQSLIIPSIELSAQDPTDAQTTVKTQLTTADTVYFVSGVYKGQGVSAVAAASTTAIAAAASSAGPFVYPGTYIKVFPLGLIISCIWAGILGGAVGFGVIRRIQWRSAYRSRVRRVATMDVKRI